MDEHNSLNIYIYFINNINSLWLAHYPGAKGTIPLPEIFEKFRIEKWLELKKGEEIDDKYYYGDDSTCF